VFANSVCYSPCALDVDQLLNTDPNDLIEGLKKLRDERAGIESKEAILKQLLDIHMGKGGEVAEQVAIFAAQNGIGPLREQIRQVLASKQSEEPLMMPVQVHTMLGALGNRSVTIDNIRVTMKRMADDGELVRPDSESLLYGLTNVPQQLLDLVKENQPA
jgi:hypothetical protein